MAEHGSKKSSGHGGDHESEGIHVVEIIFGILIFLYFLSLVGGFLSKHLNGVSVDGAGPNSPGIFSAVGSALGRMFINVFPSIQFIAIFLTLLFIMGIIYASFRLHHVHKRISHELHERQRERLNPVEEVRKNTKWERVLAHANSDNPNDWRLAVLEADILLSDMLEKMGYHGEGIGEMLKKVEESDFHTINNAWEAHKIRNAIAHEGADFILSKKEAQRVISLYQSVFEEFRFI